jgi:hypothetical protein
VLVLDDLHWADPDTFALIDYLAGAFRRRPFALIGAARDDEPAARALDRLTTRRDVSVVRLARLPHGAAVTLAERRAGRRLDPSERERLTAAADGLPLLVEELGDALRAGGAVPAVPAAAHRSAPVPPRAPAGGVPPALRSLVRERLAGLPETGRRVVSAAALLPGELDVPLLAEVVGVSGADVVAALRDAHPGLLIAAEDRSRWRHALTRDAVLAETMPAERAEWARRAADRLLARGDRAAAAELLAVAGERRRLAGTLLVMARHDAGRGALRSAAALLDRADATGECAAETAAVRVRVRTAAGQAAVALAEGLPRLAGTAGDEHAELCLALAEAAVAAGRWSTASELLVRAGRPDDPRMLSVAAEAAYGAGDLSRAAVLAGRAVDAAETAGHAVPWPAGPASGAAEVAGLAGTLRLTPLQALAEILMAAAPATAGDTAAMEGVLASAVGRPDAAPEVVPLAATIRALRAVTARDHAAAIVELDTATTALRRHDTAAPVPVWGLWALLRTVAGDRALAPPRRRPARGAPRHRRRTGSAGPRPDPRAAHRGRIRTHRRAACRRGLAGGRRPGRDVLAVRRADREAGVRRRRGGRFLRHSTPGRVPVAVRGYLLGAVKDLLDL